MRKKSRLGMALVGVLLWPTMALADEGSVEGLAWTCAGCHGPAGASPGRTIPTIAGLRPRHFSEALQRYRSGERSFYVMRIIAKGLSDAEIDALAKHYGAQAFVPTATTGGGVTAMETAACSACHGADGKGTDKGPRLAGQPAEYLEIAMVDYRSGARKTSPEMAEAMRGLSPAALASLSRYFAAMR